jgi:hypothetical protein
MTDTTSDKQAAHRAECDSVEQRLNEWRARLDELRVQVDLGAMDVRDEFKKNFAIAENVFLAAQSRLADARKDASSDLKEMRHDVEQLLGDLKGAFDTASAVIRRGGG